MLLLLFSLSFSLIEISIFPLHYFSLSLSKAVHFLIKKKKKLCILFAHSSHFSPPHSKAQQQQQQAPLKISPNRERDPLKFQLPNPHFKPHNTALITFKLHFSLFSNSHNTGILHSIYIYIYIYIAHVSALPLL